MYLWMSRFIRGHAGSAVVDVPSELPGGLSPPASPFRLPPPSAYNAALDLVVEHHQFLVPGLATTKDIAPRLPALTPWLMCAVRRALRPPGAPSCTELSLGWSALFWGARVQRTPSFVLAPRLEFSERTALVDKEHVRPDYSNTTVSELAKVNVGHGVAQISQPQSRFFPLHASTLALHNRGEGRGRDIALAPGSGLELLLKPRALVSSPSVDVTPMLGASEPLYALRLTRIAGVPVWIGDDDAGSGGVPLRYATGIVLFLGVPNDFGAAVASGTSIRPLLRAYQRRGVLPIALSPASLSSWNIVDSVPGCDAGGRVSRDIERILAVITALQYRINSARRTELELRCTQSGRHPSSVLLRHAITATPAHGSMHGIECEHPPIHVVPVYTSCSSSGCDMAALLLPHVQVSCVLAFVVAFRCVDDFQRDSQWHTSVC